jgi:hypothetical protein
VSLLEDRLLRRRPQAAEARLDLPTGPEAVDVVAVVLDLAHRLVDVLEEVDARGALGDVVARVERLADDARLVGLGQGLLTFISVAASSAAPNASTSRGLTSPQMSKSASSSTTSGTGMMTASSRASRYLLPQFISEVCFIAVSEDPSTQ